MNLAQICRLTSSNQREFMLQVCWLKDLKLTVFCVPQMATLTIQATQVQLCTLSPTTNWPKLRTQMRLTLFSST
jgi:hypothetical protein